MFAYPHHLQEYSRTYVCNDTCKLLVSGKVMVVKKVSIVSSPNDIEDEFPTFGDHSSVERQFKIHYIKVSEHGVVENFHSLLVVMIIGP